MEKVFEWVEETTKWLRIAIVGKRDDPQNNILNARKQDNDGLPIEEFREYVEALSKGLMCADDGGRKFIFRHLFNQGLIFFLLRKHIDPFEIEINPTLIEKLNPTEIKNIRNTIFTIIIDLDNFYLQVYHYCLEWGYNIEQLLDNSDFSGELRPLVYEYYEHRTIQPQQNLQGNRDWRDYIIGENKQAWIKLIKEELKSAGNKNGRLVATIILALQQTSSILAIQSKKQFYDALRADFPNLNSDTAINKYLNAESPNSYTTPIPEDEIIAIINKIGCY